MHGTTSAYAHDECRCAECKRMWAAYHKAYRMIRQQVLGLCTKCGDPAFGKVRCKRCAEAHREYMRNRRRAAWVQRQEEAA